MRKLLYKIICPVGAEFNGIGALVMLILRRSRKVVNHYHSFDLSYLAEFQLSYINSYVNQSCYIRVSYEALIECFKL